MGKNPADLKMKTFLSVIFLVKLQKCGEVIC